MLERIDVMFDRSDTYTKVVAIIAQALNLDKNEVGESKSFDELGADSLDRLEMIMRFEETFGIDISDDQEADIKTVQQAVDIIHSLRTQ